MIGHDEPVRTGGPEQLDAVERRRLGAWYTPADLVGRILDEVLDPVVRGVEPGEAVRVLDPACGDGRFLVAARERIDRAGRRAVLVGVDVDSRAIATARAALGRGARLVTADALDRRWNEQFDVVVGNPPFLSQLSSATSRGGRSAHGGGPYADAAVEFLALACRLARPDGGRIGLVLPTPVVATRDAAEVRRVVLADGALTWFWWTTRPVFDAQVRTCAVAIVRGATGRRAPRQIRRASGASFAAAPSVATSDFVGASARSGTWSILVQDGRTAPPLPDLSVRAAALGGLAAVKADFRDEYYGLVDAVTDGGSGAPLVTSGLIDPGRCRWGERSTRFAKQRYAAPRVDVERLPPELRPWAAERLVPKVLVASQTRVIEAVADPRGEWLPCVPVVSVLPRRRADVWSVAALLTSPVASAWLAARSAGSGLSAVALRVSAPVLAGLPLPAGDLSPAVSALRTGDLERCAVEVDRAYGVDGPAGERLLDWWLSASKVRSG